MTTDERIRAVAEFLVGNDAELSIYCEMHPASPLHPKWCKMRAALNLNGYPTVVEAECRLRALLKPEPRNRKARR